MDLACYFGGCLFMAPANAAPAAAMQVIINHVTLVHPDQIPRARDQRIRPPPPLVRPSIDIGCSPAQWADFLARWTRFRSGCSIPADQLTTQAMECFSNDLISTADKAVYNIGALDLDSLLREVKAVAVLPVAVGILRATAHSAKQACGERFQAFAAKVRGLTTDYNYVLPCPHATAAAQACATVLGCSDVDYTSEVIKDILLSGIYNLNVRREVLGTAGIENTSVNDLVRIVEAKEAACDAAGCSRTTATEAAALFKKPVRQEAAGQPPRPGPRAGHQILHAQRR